LINARKKNKVQLNKQIFSTSITFLLGRCPNNKQPISGPHKFWGLNELALLDQKINKNQLTMLSGQLDHING
jgi:hypothetical protein